MNALKSKYYRVSVFLAVFLVVLSFVFIFSVYLVYAADSDSAGFKFGGGRYTTGDTRRYVNPTSSSEPVEQEFIQSFDMGISCDDDVLVVPFVLDFVSDWNGYHHSGCGVIFLSKNRLSGRSYELDYHSKIERLYLAEDDKNRRHENSYIQTRDFTSFNPITIDGVYIDYYVFADSGLYKDGVSNFSFGVPYLILNDLRINGVNSSDNFQRLAQAFKDGTLSGLPEFTQPDLGNDFQDAEKVKNTDLGYISGAKYAVDIVRETESTPQASYFHWTWDPSRTTSGYNYVDGDFIQVQVMLTMSYNELYWFNSNNLKTNWHDFKMVSASSGKFDFSLTSQSEYDAFYAIFGDERDMSGLLPKVTAWSINYRFRVVHRNGSVYEYGHWLTSSKTQEGKPSTFTSTDEDGNPVTDNPEYTNGQLTNPNVGVGDNVDDAENNRQPTNGTVVQPGGGSGSGGLFGSDLDAETFINQIGQIPGIISAVFSFLPAWCLGFIAAGFALFVTLMLIKIIRG